MLSLHLASCTDDVLDIMQAMKTIAVLTLTFLPGTAVASFFSM